MAYTEEEARGLIIEAGHRLLETHLVARTWGNISARISDTEFLITPSGRAYETLTEDELNAFCMGLPRYKRPRKVIFAEVPRNPTGKIEKPKLRKMYGAAGLVAQQNEIKA